jgi:hypothetical protein
MMIGVAVIAVVVVAGVICFHFEKT